MKRKISILLTVLFFYGNITSGLAQSGCYEQLCQKGLDLLKQNKCEEALNQFNLAKNCDDYNNNKNIDDLIDRANRCIKNQANAKPVLTQTVLILPDGTEYEYLPTAGSDTISVTFNANIEIVEKSARWLTAQVIDKGIFVTWQENTSPSPRKCTFKVKIKDAREQTVTVTQQGAKLYLNIANSIVAFVSKGGSKTVVAETNSDSLNLSSNGNEWCKITQNLNRLYIECKPNTKKDKRSFSFDVMAGNESLAVTVNQSGLSLNISDVSYSFPSSGGNKTISIFAPDIGSWSITNENLEHGFSIKSKDDNSVTVAAAVNNSVQPRSCKIIVKAGDATETIYLSQDGVPVQLSASETSITFSGLGGSNTVKVKTNALSWKVVDKPVWCRITENTTSNSFSVIAEKNENNRIRRDTIKIIADGGKEYYISVTQDEKVYPLKIKYHPVSCRVGFQAGFIQKYWNYSDDNSKWGIFDEGDFVKGFQTGIRIDPYFKPSVTGLGMHTGVFYQYYTKSNTKTQYLFKEHTVTVPVHLNYRYDFGESGKVGIFAHIGPNFDYGLNKKHITNKDNADYEENIYDRFNRFNLALGYGAGFQFKQLLLEIGGYSGLTNHSGNPDYKIKQSSNLSVAIVIMFN
jgi:hypothetical protein